MSKTQLFIEKARAVHGDRYDYSKTVYVRTHDRVTITCKEHGDFEQVPTNHLAARGCAKCSGFNKTTKEWIIEAKKTHGDRYDYSKTVYVRARGKVIITCQEHGDFNQVANRHLQGGGCPKCRGLNKTSKEWIIEAKKMHGDRYDYSKTVYARTHDRVTITCKEHGDFEQRPYSHLAGNGCAKCSGAHQYSTAEWIIEAKKTHGDRYDYSKTVYVRSRDKVIITCKEHGDFEQVAFGHLAGNGCAKCSGAHQYSTVEWIIEAKKMHGDRYDYSKTVYARACDSVTITCKEHGDFEQVAGGHLRGRGCSKCSGQHQYSTAEWIIEAKKMHGDRYDYSKTVYVRTHDRVTITCKEHGDFEQEPANHLVGKGCSKCSSKHRRSTAEWIIEAKKTHGDRYDYSKTVYVRRCDRVTITCKEHGDFEQVAASHARGIGCAKCSGKHQYSTAEWIIEAKKTHDDRYDYSKTVYVRSTDKVVITCKEHGDFEQRAADHLIGKGCQRCLFNRDQPTAIYLMQMGAQVKIGISIDPDTRLAQLNRDNPEPARIVTAWTLKDFPTAYAMEQQLHQRLCNYHAGLTGFDGATEWFNTTPCHAEWVIAGFIGQHL